MSIISDLNEALDRIAGLEADIDRLEALINRNDARLKTQEQFMADHQAGAARRQQEVDRLTTDNQRLAYQQRTGRQA